MASGNIPRAVHGWGTPTTVTFPFTPTVDGFVSGYFAAASSGNAYMYFKEDNAEFFRCTVPGLSGGIAFPVKAGSQYTISLQSNVGSNSIKFYPFA